MKRLTILLLALLVAAYFILRNSSDNHQPLTQTYPWQIEALPKGYAKVFGIILEQSTLADATRELGSQPKLAVFDNENRLSLEAYYKSISRGGLIGSFVFTLDLDKAEIEKLKQSAHKKEPTTDKGWRYELDKPTIDRLARTKLKTLAYIPTVQLSEEIILSRFGQPDYRISLKTNEAGWHYLYASKGLDLIYHEETREVLQYVAPKSFNALLVPLQSD